MPYCQECGAEVGDGAAFCAECGAAVDKSTAPAAGADSEGGETGGDEPTWAQLPGLDPDHRARNLWVGFGYVVATLVILGALVGGGAGGGGGQDVYVVVDYSGDWSGAIGTAGNMRSVQGSGQTRLDVPDDATIVSANAQKRDGAAGTLTIRIMRGDEVVAQQSTSAQYGVAQVSERV
ncbi:zinc-ribbon domain-containing protein [Halorientalis persicus]|uniref:Zinc-ribbon domain-containing protein n=1 Tax=Halorientalis persicus TaxID=1367881 RepID=A0A1H8S1A9_9EURY|nr:zinc ribbon domain-containing protein [Halorientalis persicus]SEO72234.1 zinc-ribbon domain-containing protein [Halorientalis persicus]